VRCKISRLFRLHGNPPDCKQVPRGYLREVIRSVVKGAVSKFRLNRWHQTETARYLDKLTPGPRAQFWSPTFPLIGPRSMKPEFTRDTQEALMVEFHTRGGPLTFTAQDHTDFVDAFYRISQDRDNKIVILTRTGGEFIPGIDFSSFGNVADHGVWSQVHDEGVQILENLSNVHVPMIAAVEGRAHVHSEYALIANVIVASEDATFQDLPHFAGGIVPGDGIFTTWSYRAGAGRAEAFLLNPQPLAARSAQEWGVVAEVVPNGKALARALEPATLYLRAPEVTRRNTRVHFIQLLKERIVRGVGCGLSLEGASAADLVKSMQTKAAVA
jgi:enoyl-CoA hydratase/carnithine racemase